jgi:hypothetical protein
MAQPEMTPLQAMASQANIPTEDVEIRVLITGLLPRRGQMDSSNKASCIGQTAPAIPLFVAESGSRRETALAHLDHRCAVPTAARSVILSRWRNPDVIAGQRNRPALE